MARPRAMHCFMSLCALIFVEDVVKLTVLNVTLPCWGARRSASCIRSRRRLCKRSCCPLNSLKLAPQFVPALLRVRSDLPSAGHGLELRAPRAERLLEGNKSWQ